MTDKQKMLAIVLFVFFMALVTVGLRSVAHGQTLDCTPGYCGGAGQNGDSDTWPDVIDNCTNVNNEDQFDADSDGFGNRCDADFDNNGIVNSNDYLLFRSAVNTVNPLYDINHDGLVSALDYAMFRLMINFPPGPSAPRYVTLGGNVYDGTFCLTNDCLASTFNPTQQRRLGTVGAGIRCIPLPLDKSVPTVNPNAVWGMSVGTTRGITECIR